MAEGQDFTAVGVKNASVKVIKDLCLGNTQVPFFWQLFTLVGALSFKDDQYYFFIFCIYRSRAPPRNRINQDKKPLPVDIWQSLIDAKVEQFCSDAALDAQVCSELLQHEFKGLKVRAKDVTHATRRTPWDLPDKK